MYLFIYYISKEIYKGANNIYTHLVLIASNTWLFCIDNRIFEMTDELIYFDQ